MSKKTTTFSFGHKIIHVFKRFYEFTSIGGITQIRDSHSKSSKCTWLILTIFAMLLTIVLVNRSIETYLNYETVTKIRMRSDLKLDFPSVTICNQNRIHCRNLYNLIQSCTAVRIVFWL